MFLISVEDNISDNLFIVCCKELIWHNDRYDGRHYALVVRSAVFCYTGHSAWEHYCIDSAVQDQEVSKTSLLNLKVNFLCQQNVPYKSQIFW